MGKKTNEYVSSRVSSVIGKGTEIEGIIRPHELIRIEGSVKGQIISEGTVIIGRGGYIDGIINADILLAGGEIRGEIFAKKVEVNPSGKIFGDIHTKSLIVDEKAIFEGRCEMTDQNQSEE